MLILNRAVASVRHRDVALSFSQKNGIAVAAAGTNLPLQCRAWLWLLVVPSVVAAERLGAS